jgi:hypothetical protein
MTLAVTTSARARGRIRVGISAISRGVTLHMNIDRRRVLAAPLLLAAVAGCDTIGGRLGLSPLAVASASPPDPNETFVLSFDRISFQAWGISRRAAAKWQCSTAISTSRALTS